MKPLLLITILLASAFLTGCETIVETRRPVVYGTTYNNGYYREPSHDYYYRNGRRYDRNVVVVNRPVAVRPTIYDRRPNTVVVRRSVNPRDRRRYEENERSDHNKNSHNKKKKHHDDDDNDR